MKQQTLTGWIDQYLIEHLAEGLRATLESLHHLGKTEKQILATVAAVIPKFSYTYLSCAAYLEELAGDHSPQTPASKIIALNVPEQDLQGLPFEVFAPRLKEQTEWHFPGSICQVTLSNFADEAYEGEEDLATLNQAWTAAMSAAKHDVFAAKKD